MDIWSWGFGGLDSWVCVAVPSTYTVILKKLNEPGGGKK